MDLDWAEALEALQSPFFHEDLSLSKAPILVVRVSGEAEATGPAVNMLHSLRAVTIAVLDDGVAEAAATEIATAFDVVLRPGSLSGTGIGDAVSVAGEVDHRLGELQAGVSANPLASVALVQLLRMSPQMSVTDGLVAESLTYSMLQSGPEFGLWAKNHKPGAAPPDTEPPVLSSYTDSGSGAELVITLNRPARANAVSAAMRDALVPLLRTAAADTDRPPITLNGAGDNFCSGGDLGEFATFVDPAQAHAIRLARSPASLLHLLSGRSTARIHGACAGSGIELPAFAGRVVASADVDIWLPEIALGLVPGAGGTVSLARRIGRQRTNWLALTGVHIDAGVAQAWGLVDEIAEHGRVP